MSCFIVSQNTIERAVCAVALGESHGGSPRMESHAGDQLIKEMWELNYRAYGARYRTDDRDEPPIEREQYRMKVFEPLDAYKGLQCLLYQCCEAGIPDTSDLYKRMDAARNKLATQIVERLPDYDLMSWDGCRPTVSMYQLAEFAEHIAIGIDLRYQLSCNVPVLTTAIRTALELLPPKK